jgi:6-phosphogluconolactonase (cycloisomerase 2 family)
VGASGTELFEIKIDPSGKFLYVVSEGVVNNVLFSGVYAYVINPSDGSLTTVPGSPFSTGNDGTGALSLVFDASGTYLYTANSFDNNGALIGSVSAYSLDVSTGALTPLANSPYAIAGSSQPVQIARAGNYLYVVDNAANAVDVFAIAAGTGELTQNVPGAPFATDLGPYSITVNQSGSLLFTANSGPIPAGQFNGPGSLSGFTINSSTGMLTPTAGSPLPISSSNEMAMDPQGKYLFTTTAALDVNGSFVYGVSVYPINETTGAIGTAVAGSPFATGINPFSISIDKTGNFVYVGNDGSASISEFTLNGTTGVLTPVAGSPVAAGTSPDFIAIM